MSKVSIEKNEYKHFGKCVKISNGIVEVIITLEYGPRIISYSLTNRENVFNEDVPTEVDFGDEKWKLVGGHRLCHSPEVTARTYTPDNNPVECIELHNGVRIIQEQELKTQMSKKIEIVLNESSSEVNVSHIVTNNNAWNIEFSAWAVSAMARGGKEIVPLPERPVEALPNGIIAVWPYGRMNDKRVHWGDKYMTLSQDVDMKNPFKVGISNENGWAAYYIKNTLFVKQYKHEIGNKYPDYGVSYETYTSEYLLEMETLSPLKVVKPGESIVHNEIWKLAGDISMNLEEEEEISLIMQKLL